MLLAHIKRFITWLALILYFNIGVFAQANEIVGPNPVSTYSISRYIPDFASFLRVEWTVTGGTIVNTGPQGAYIDIQFDGNEGYFNISAEVIVSREETIEVFFYGTKLHNVLGGTIGAVNSTLVYGLEQAQVNSSNPGGGYCPNAFSYVWERSTDNVNWEVIPDAKDANLKEQDFIRQTTYYRRKLVSCNGNAYSNTVTIATYATLAGGKIGVSQTIQPGAVPQSINNITLPVGGISGSYAYQWESSADDLTWQSISGATSVNYQPPAVQGTLHLRRKVVSGTQSRYSNTVRIIAHNAVSRNVPANATVTPSQPVATVPSYAGLTNTHFNQVNHYFVGKPGVTTVNQLQSEEIGKAVNKNINFIDGAGRKVQTINQQASFTQKDIISVNVYDQFGREQVKHLPYAAETNSGNIGSFRTDVNVAQPQFLKGILGTGNDYFYSTVKSEEGMQSRFSYNQMPGNSFSGSGIKAKQEVRINTENDNIRIWEIGDDPSSLPISTAVYAPGVLTVIEITNEQGDKRLEYHDKSGDVVCSRTYTSPAADETEGLTTYYVFNELGQNRFIIPPLATKYCLQNNNWDFASNTNITAIAKDLCQKFVYNEKGEIIRKQLPQAEFEEEYIYDNRGRLVFSRNSLLRSRNLGEWMLMFYDDLDRPVITALYTNPSATYASLQALVNQAAGSSVIQISSPAPIDLYVENRDGLPQKYEASNSITILPGFESETSAEIEFEINPGMAAPIEHFSVSNPVPGITNYEVLSLQYYDNYNWPGSKSFSTNFQIDAGSNLYPMPVIPRKDAREFMTGFKRKILGQNRMLTSIVYYDERGNVIQEQMENIVGGWDISTRQYDFSDKLLSGYMRHQNPQSTTTPEVKVGFANTYTNFNVLSSVKHTIYKDGGNIVKNLTSFTYDEAGRLINQTLGSLETLNYTYSPLGKIAGINAAYAQNGSGGHYFGMEVKYEQGFEKSRLDGQISGVTWRRIGNPEELHAYGFDYDGSHRLTKADYAQQNGGTWSNANADYDAKIPAYDENGNILQMTQNGMLLGNVKTELDNLTYAYDKNGFSNKLLTVTDSKGNQQQGDFKDVNDGLNDYSYDPEGNMTQDRNRGVSITYDFLLNKPVRIQLDADPSKSVEYVYAVNGDKLKQIVKDGTATTTYTYVNGFVYRNNELQLFGHTNGRVRRNQNGEFIYDYFIKDYLGNTRTVITEESNIIYYKATHEDNPQPVPAIPEREAFNFPANVDDIPVGHKFYDYNGTNRKFIKLNANISDRKIGTSKVLRVMAGDAVETGVYSYYQQNSPANNVPDPPINTIVTQLAQVLLGPATTVIANGHGNLLQSNSNQNILNTNDIGSFIGNNQQQQATSQVPKAYLNYALFDDNFKMVSGGVIRVSSPDVLTPLATQINVTKNGYLYVFISNESPTDVYFDDLAIKHTTGHLLQEDTYYPYGLGIRSLSSKALNRLENKYLFNGIEKLTEFDLEIFDAQFRNLDPQTGRWWQRDPMTEKYFAQSPYHLSGNNPINHTDPLGDDYFKGRDGSIIWLDSHTLSTIIGGDVFTNIGTTVGFEQNGLYELHINGSLAYIGFASPTFYRMPGTHQFLEYTEHATPYFKGQEPFVLFIQMIGKNGLLPQFRKEIYQKNLKHEATYAKSIYGGISSGIEDKIRIKSDQDLIPTLRAAYALTYPGRNENLTVLTNDEAKSVLLKTTAELAISWAPQIAALKALNVPRPPLKAPEIVPVGASRYEGVRGLSKYLIASGIDRTERLQIIRSFEEHTISIGVADDATFALRFWGGGSNEYGRYLFPTFTNYTTREGMALLPKWNSMTKLTQFQIRPGTFYFSGRAVSQGGRFTGGSMQIFIGNPGTLANPINLIKLYP